MSYPGGAPIPAATDRNGRAEEAGGKVTDFEGKPYQLGGPIILATNGLIHDEMCTVAVEISRRGKGPGWRR